MSLFHVGRVLSFKREGNILHGYATVIQGGNMIQGDEQFMIAARSKSALKRKLADLCPDMPVKTRAFLKVKITLE